MLASKEEGASAPCKKGDSRLRLVSAEKPTAKIIKSLREGGKEKGVPVNHTTLDVLRR